LDGVIVGDEEAFAVGVGPGGHGVAEATEEGGGEDFVAGPLGGVVAEGAGLDYAVGVDVNGPVPCRLMFNG
jgi:hypothetical protein